MEYGPSAWLQQQHVPDVQSVHSTRPSQAQDEWKDPPSASGSSSSAAGQTGVDLSDFVLGDIPGEHASQHPPDTSALFYHRAVLCEKGPTDSLITAPTPSTNSVPSQPSSFYTFPQHNLFVSGAPGPYNAVPYGGSHWVGSTPPQQLPLSNYSTLNGATSTTVPGSHPQPSSVSQLMIEYVSFFTHYSLPYHVSLAQH